MTRLARFSIVVLVANLVVILWGAYVRATGSGAGCGAHWPLCNGEVTLRAETSEMFVELTHRVTSGLAFLLVLALLVLVRRVTRDGHPARKAAAGAMVFMVIEALLGAGLVLFELVGNNASLWRAGSMAVHLANTFVLLAFLGLTCWHLTNDGRPIRWRPFDAPRRWVGLTLALMIVVGATGAVAALGDTLFPPDSLSDAFAAEFDRSSHILVRLRVWHPLVAVATSMLVLFLPQLVGRERHDSRAKRWGAVAGLAALTQLGIGALNVSLLAPIWLQLSHLLVADLLWLAAVIYAATLFADDTPTALTD